MDEIKSNSSECLDELTELLRTFTIDQLRYVAVRQDCSSDREAAIRVGVKPPTVSGWGEPVRRAVRLMAMDGILVSREILRRALPKAAEIKVAGLNSNNEKIRQEAATEILDRWLGKAAQPITGPAGDALKILVEYADSNDKT